MKLIRAEFENFRLLRHLKLDFSTDISKRLTVVRAENETGKTTILNGLQWALYGDDALPGRGQDYRLHPIDWDASEGKRVPISVQVEFETIAIRRSPKGLIETKHQYRIIRSAHETLKWCPLGPHSVNCKAVSPDGDRKRPYRPAGSDDP